MTTTPGHSGALGTAVPGEPTATVPDEPTATVPDEPTATVSDEPATAVSDGPGTAELEPLGAAAARRSRLLSRLGWPDRRWVAAAVCAAAGVVLFAAYLRQARTMGIHIDAASASAPQTLQAWDMLHGNPLLRGWELADVPFYPIDLPVYMLVELVRGVSGDTAHVAAALIYTLIVLLAGLLAKGRATGREGLIRLLVAVGIMLAPSLVAGTSVLLSGPDHTGTQLALLAIWLALDRAPTRWWLPVLVTVLLVWALVADTIVLVEGVLPLVVVCAIRMYRRRGPLAGHWYDLSLAGGALISVAAAKVVLAVIRQAGGFYVRTPVASFATAASLSAQFWLKVQRVLELFGAGFFGQPLRSSTIIALVHLVGVALVGWAVAVGVRRFFGYDNLVVQVLIVAFIALAAAYLFGTKPDPNEMVGLLPIGAVLAGRLLAGRLSDARLMPALAAVLACYAGILVGHAVPPAASDRSQPAASWFTAHHLTYGLGQFGEAGIVTVDSGNRVQVRPVRLYNHRLVTTPWENEASWYDANHHDATFVIWQPPTGCGNHCPAIADIRQTFGPPTSTYRLDGFVVLVWRQNLLANLPTLNWCGAAWPWNATGHPSLTPCH